MESKMEWFAISDIELRQFHMAGLVAGGGDAVLPVVEGIRERKISYPEDPTYIALRKGDVILPDDYVAREDSFKVIGNTVSVGKRWNKTAYYPMYRKVKK
jgi:hypothetical protein